MGLACLHKNAEPYMDGQKFLIKVGRGFYDCDIDDNLPPDYPIDGWMYKYGKLIGGLEAKTKQPKYPYEYVKRMGSYISSAHKFDIGAQMVMEEHVPLYLLLLFPESGIIMHGKIADENGEYLVGVKYCYGMSQKTCESDLKVLKRNIEIDINDLQILW